MEFRKLDARNILCDPLRLCVKQKIKGIGKE